MGSIEKRGKNSWRITVAVKTASGWTPIHVPLKMDPSLPEEIQRQDALRELAQLELRLSAPAQTITLREWSAQWLEKHQQPDSSPVTIANYRNLLDSRILPLLGDVCLADLTPARLTDWLITVRNSPRKTTRKADEELKRPRRKNEKLIPPSKQARPLSAKTVLHYYTCLNTMLQAAVRMGYLDHNPMDRVQRPRQHKKKPAAYSEEQAVRLLRDILALDDSLRKYRTAVLLALLCGLRLGEVGGLRYSDVDFIHGTISVSRALKYTGETGSFEDAPKSDAAIRVITLPPSMVAYLQNEHYLDNFAKMEADFDALEKDTPSRWIGDGWIVHNNNGGQLNKDTPSRWFRRFATAHGYGHITFHDLRHAHASFLVAHNIDIAAIAARMGHSNATVTLANYTHPYAAQDINAATALDQLLQQITPQPSPTPDPAAPAAPAVPPPSADA